MEHTQKTGCAAVDDTADRVRESAFGQASPDLNNVVFLREFSRVDFREAALETMECEDCDGRGIDPGSLYEPEPCPVCQGTGHLFVEEPESAGRASMAERAVSGADGWRAKEVA